MDLSKLLRLRKVTRAVEEHFRGELEVHLRSLQPLFKPHNVLGEHIRNAPKQTVKVADASLKELRTLYMRVGRVKPFRFEDDIQPPIDVFGAAAAITPVTYDYKPQGYENEQAIRVTSPLRWVLSYKGLGPDRLQEFLSSKSGTARIELQSCLLHYLVMHILLTQELGVAPILRALRFNVDLAVSESFGGLPMVYISAPVETLLPGDEVIVQSTELSGAAAFEEIVDIDSILRLEDPVKGALVGLVAGFGDDLLVQDKDEDSS